MKLNQLAWLGLASLIVTTAPLASLAAPQTATPNRAEAESTLPQEQTVALAAGKFIATEQPTTGVARIIEANGRRYLELDSNFRTSNQGTDLYVILNESSRPPTSYDDLEQLNLGRLQNYSGTQRYAIADDVDVDDYHSVSIWSQTTNATSGQARLRFADKRESWMPTFSELYWERSDG